MHDIDHAADNTREERINDAFVRVAGTLVDNYDVVDLLSTLVHTCTQLLDVQSGGILLADGTGMLELVASTSEEAETVEVMIVAEPVSPMAPVRLTTTESSSFAVPVMFTLSAEFAPASVTR